MAKPHPDVPFAVASGNRVALIAMTVICIFLLLGNVVLATAWAVQYARKEKTPEPIIFEVNKAALKVVRVEKGNLGETKQSLLRSVSLRNYVSWRETLNHIDENDRWKKVRLMSSRDTYRVFFNMMNPDVNKRSPYANKAYNRKIEIITDYPISDGVHRVEFYATDTISGETHPSKRFVAVIRYQSSDAFVSYDDRFINIDGLLITRYDIHEA